jgi:hypothetical protein
MSDVTIKTLMTLVPGGGPFHMVSVKVNNAKHSLHDQMIAVEAKSAHHAESLALRMKAALSDCTDLRVEIET